MSSITIQKRFCGPPNSGNGGYTAGIIAANVPFSPKVTLRTPPPLDHSMQLESTATTARLLNKDIIVAEAKVTDLQLSIPPSVSFEEASMASMAADAYESLPFHTCFVCGMSRAKEDGLRIQPRTIGQQKVAAPWVPFANLGNEADIVQEPFVWAALDCPGVWAIQDLTQFYLLGQMAAKISHPIMVGKKYVILGWVIAAEGRKTWTGTAIYDETQHVCAYAQGTWITIKKEN